MATQLLSPLPHIPLSHSRRNHIPASRLSLPAEANTLHRSSIPPLTGPPSETSPASSLIDVSHQTTLSALNVLQNVTAPFRFTVDWSLLLIFNSRNYPDAANHLLPTDRRPQASRTHSSLDVPCSTPCFCPLTCKDMPPSPVDLTFTSQWQRKMKSPQREHSTQYTKHTDSVL